MDDRFVRQFNHDHLVGLLARYGIGVEDVVALDGFESFIYKVINAAPRLIRIGHSERRSSDQVAAELQFINYLADNHVSVCRALPSTSGELLETVPAEEGEFIAVCFAFAPGGPVEVEDWGYDLHRMMGRLAGQMHRLASHYPTDGQRPDWYEESAGLVHQHIPAEQMSIVTSYNLLTEEIGRLPKERDSFGLIHCDFHRGNFHFRRKVEPDGQEGSGSLYLFDFDDCQYSWFADDIALALFYAIPHDCRSRSDRTAAVDFLRAFLEGYREVYNFDTGWLSRLPLFMKRREFELYAVIHRSFDVADITDPWARSFMVDRKSRLENGVPYLDIDFERVGAA